MRTGPHLSKFSIDWVETSVKLVAAMLVNPCPASCLGVKPQLARMRTAPQSQCLPDATSRAFDATRLSTCAQPHLWSTDSRNCPDCDSRSASCWVCAARRRPQAGLCTRTKKPPSIVKRLQIPHAESASFQHTISASQHFETLSTALHRDLPAQ